MNHRKLRWAALATALAGIVMLGACNKKAHPAPPPLPPPAPAASLTVNPETIQRGQSSTLNWRTENATDVTIDPVGKVAESGTEIVNPIQSTVYQLTAKGPGGTTQATARITVLATPPPPPSPPRAQRGGTLRPTVRDIFFDFDKSDIRADQHGGTLRRAGYIECKLEAGPRRQPSQFNQESFW
jgi:peptidoglycan-associated lipoprotein